MTAIYIALVLQGIAIVMVAAVGLYYWRTRIRYNFRVLDERSGGALYLRDKLK